MAIFAVSKKTSSLLPSVMVDGEALLDCMRPFENTRTVAGHGVFYAIAHTTANPKAWSFVNRGIGWSWRAFDRYWELIGEAMHKNAVMKATDDRRTMLRAGIGEREYFPPSAHWLLTPPPRPRGKTGT